MPPTSPSRKYIVPEEQLIVIDSPPRFQATMERKLTCEDRDRARTLTLPRFHVTHAAFRTPERCGKPLFGGCFDGARRFRSPPALKRARAKGPML
jgi:hypothetical protein